MKQYSFAAWKNRSSVAITTGPTISPKRQWLVTGAIAALLVGLLARDAYWQIGQHAALSNIAADQQLHTLILPSDRGTITDRNGTILAMTVTGNVLVLDPLIAQQTDAQYHGTIASMAKRISADLQIAPQTVAQQLRLSTGYHMLTDDNGAIVHLPADIGDALRAQLANGQLPGAVLEPQSWRIEPSGVLASQILGFVQENTDAGQYGIEQSANTILAGTPGKLFTTVDADGQPLATGPQVATPAIPGNNVQLTIDANIQAMAEQGLQSAVTATQAAGGTVIVEDPQTGAILALANSPTFDPNFYSASPMANLQDPAVDHMYDPGSTMKAITMAAGIDLHVISPDTSFDDQGSIVVGGQTINNWNQLAWGSETMTQVLEHSANVGAAWVAVNRIGAKDFYRYIQAFGFGQKTQVTLPGEIAGLLPPQEPTQDLAQLDLAENAFGESIDVTPLQMVMAYGALANGGVLMQPMIIQSTSNNGSVQARQPVEVRRIISTATAGTITQMLQQSALTSDAQTLLLPGYSVAAKTGTSTPDPSNPSITYASVIGYAPTDHPRFVIFVKLDRPQTTIFGGEAAGPLWRQLVRQLTAYFAAIPQEGAK